MLREKTENDIQIAQTNSMYGIKIKSPIERIPMKGLIRIMMTEGLYGIFPHGDITIAVYETLEYAKNAEKVLNL